jgi:uncharacterized membrane protein YphA (DoxX/SURF4 family)
VNWLTVLDLGIRLLAGGLLLIAGLAKLRMGYVEVLKSVVGYKILPFQAARAWARVLPPLELTLGGALVAGVFVPLVATAAAMLMLVLTVAVAQAVIRGRKAACGCFAPGGNLVSWSVVVRNSLITAALASLVMGGTL